MKKAAVIFLLLLLLTAAWCRWNDAILQRGNPLPYLHAAAKLGTAQSFVEVVIPDQSPNTQIYLTKAGTCPALLDDIAETRQADFQEQFGAAYLFSDGQSTFSVHTEVYWGRYCIWDVPKET